MSGAAGRCYCRRSRRVSFGASEIYPVCTHEAQSEHRGLADQYQNPNFDARTSAVRGAKRQRPGGWLSHKFVHRFQILNADTDFPL